MSKHQIIKAITSADVARLVRLYHHAEATFLVHERPPHISHIPARTADELAALMLAWRECDPYVERRHYYHVGNLNGTNEWVVLWP